MSRHCMSMAIILTPVVACISNSVDVLLTSVSLYPYVYSVRHVFRQCIVLTATSLFAVDLKLFWMSY